MPQCRQNDFSTFISDKFPRSFKIDTAEEKAAYLACPESPLHAFCTAAEKRVFSKTIQIEGVIIPAFTAYVRHSHMQHARAK